MSQRQLSLTQTCLNAKKKFDGRAYGFPAAGSGLFVQHPMIHYVSRVSHQSSHCLTKLCWPNNITGLGNTEQEVMFFVEMLVKVVVLCWLWWVENSTHHVLLIFFYGTNREPRIAINMFMLLKLVVFQIFF